MSELFKGIMKGIEQATEHLEGKANGSKTTRLSFMPNITVRPTDIKTLRKRLGLSQQELAMLLDVGIDTVRKWEQGRNTPEGPSRRMLQALQMNGRPFVELFLQRA